MALGPPDDITPHVSGNATAEGMHPPVDMHQVGDLVPEPCKMHSSATTDAWLGTCYMTAGCHRPATGSALS